MILARAKNAVHRYALCIISRIGMVKVVVFSHTTCGCSTQRFHADAAAATNETHRALDVVGWLDGLVQQVGVTKARLYLKGAGLVVEPQAHP
jgi:hypothetical protein